MDSSIFHCFSFVGNKMRSRQRIFKVKQMRCPLGSRCHTERTNDNITNILYLLSMGYLKYAAGLYGCDAHVQAIFDLNIEYLETLCQYPRREKAASGSGFADNFILIQDEIGSELKPASR